MWIFGAYGYLLPVITEEDDELRDHPAWNDYSFDGEFTFQVRARMREHLEYYLEHFAEEGTYGAIWATPDHDYNYRVMTTQKAFADAMHRSIMDIDYRNFKDQSLAYPRGKEYHDLLLDIWFDSCKLGDGPGGFYGPRSAENPNGYVNANTYYVDRWKDDDTTGIRRRIGDSFQNIDFGDEYPEEGEWETVDADSPEWAKDNEWYSEEDLKIDRIVHDLDEMNVPMSDWYEFVTPREFAIIQKRLKGHFSKKTIKSMRNKNKKMFYV